MADFKQDVIDMDASLFNEFGVDGLYQGVTPCRLVLDLNVEQYGPFDTSMPARRHEVSFLVSQIKDAKRGETIKVKSDSYTLDGSISNDGIVARWHINAS